MNKNIACLSSVDETQLALLDVLVILLCIEEKQLVLLDVIFFGV